MNYLSVYNNLKNQSSTIKLLFELDGRQYTLARLSTDLVWKTLKRIGLSVQKATTKQDEKKNEQKSSDTKDIPVKLFLQSGELVDDVDEVSNSEAWCEGNVLHIADEKFFIEENTPIVLSTTIPSVIMSGFPVVPTLKLDFSDKIHSQYKWFKQTTQAEMQKTCSDGIDAPQDESEKAWTEIGQEFVYVPTIDDIGCPLKLSCKAASLSKEAHKWYSVVGSSPVSASPGVTPFETRQLYTAMSVSDPSVVRVVSYNILGDCYLEDDATREAWFGYCPKYALEIDYRQQLLLKEILGYNGDIICLQECGRRLFNHYLSPVMKSKGYTGVAKYKTGVMVEGEAIFFKESRFKLISQHDIVIKDCFVNHPVNKDMLMMVKQTSKVLNRMKSRTTVAQLLVLQYSDCPQNYICVVNTHLYFRPNAPFIRNLQCMTILNYLNETVKKLDMELKVSREDCNIGVLFCGDFNSLPGSGLVQLMCGGSLEAGHTDWVLPQEAEESFTKLQMPAFHNPFDFQNCCGFPEFTTYTEGFKGAIDYVFASKDVFEVQAVIPLPLAEDLQVYTAIPSPVVSSDHLALICELKWKD